MMGENENLAFYLPENQGFNLFIDAMCIPYCAQEKEAAELFINFLCDPEIAGANMDWICYSTPIPAAKEFMELDEEMEAVNYEVEGGTSYLALPRETTRYVDSLFMKVRNGISLEGDNGSNVVLWIVIAVAVLAAGTVALLLIKKRKKKKR
jgi:spermidine/putrescine transport system substrate-binding protein